MSTSFIIRQSTLFKNLMKTIKSLCWTELVFTVNKRTIQLNDQTKDGCVFLTFQISDVHLGYCKTMTFKSTAFLKILRSIRGNEPISFSFDESTINVKLLTTQYMFHFTNIETDPVLIEIPILEREDYIECTAGELNKDFSHLNGLIQFHISNGVLKMSNKDISIFKSIDYDTDLVDHTYLINDFYLPAKNICKLYLFRDKLIIKSTTDACSIVLIYFAEN